MSNYKGTVLWLNASGGYGFLRPIHGGDVFVHFDEEELRRLRNLREGDPVEFDIKDSESGPQAQHVVAGTPSHQEHSGDTAQRQE